MYQLIIKKFTHQASSTHKPIIRKAKERKKERKTESMQLQPSGHHKKGGTGRIKSQTQRHWPAHSQ
jgi:hypothetical protein